MENAFEEFADRYITLLKQFAMLSDSGREQIGKLLKVKIENTNLSSTFHSLNEEIIMSLR